MLRSTHLLAALVMTTVVIAGCGGGGGTLGPLTDTASVQGTVYTTGIAPSADGASGGVPAPGAEVTAVREPGGQTLATTTADGGGQYALSGLPAGEQIMLRARLQSGEQLRARVRLQSRNCQADINEDTTMAACDDALQQALRTRLQGDCEEAVVMIEARPRQRNELGEAWGEQLRERLARALQHRWQASAQEVAQAASHTLGQQIQAGDIERWREQLRQRIRAFEGQNMEALEAAALCSGDQDRLQDQDRTRLQTRDQLRDFLNALGVPETGGVTTTSALGNQADADQDHTREQDRVQDPNQDPDGVRIRDQDRDQDRMGN